MGDKKKVTIPGLGNENITTLQEKVDSILASNISNSVKVKLSKTFMRKRKNRGVKYVYLVEWISPTNKKIKSSVLTNGELTF